MEGLELGKKPDFGWFGAGWACFKGDEVSWFPEFSDEEGIFEFFDGFAAAHADYPDMEAMEGILEGDFSRGESFDDALFRVLKFRIYDRLETLGVLERYREFCENRDDWTRRSPNSGW